MTVDEIRKLAERELQCLLLPAIIKDGEPVPPVSSGSPNRSLAAGKWAEVVLMCESLDRQAEQLALMSAMQGDFSKLEGKMKDPLSE